MRRCLPSALVTLSLFLLGSHALGATTVLVPSFEELVREAVTIVQGTSASGSNVSLSWRAPSTGGSPTAYVIEAGSASGLANLANFSTGNTATSFSAAGIGAGAYYIRVKAANAAGTSGASNESLLIVGGGACSSAPGAPSGFAASASGSTVTLRWNAAAGNPTTYVVEAGSAPGLSNLANSDLGSPATSYIATGVGRGTYYVRMRGKNACGTGPASNETLLVVQ
jgi:hypothetical protein